jgi:hypothetical protein
MNTLGRVTCEWQARVLSTTSRKNNRVSEEGLTRRRITMKNRKAWSDTLCEHDWGREKEGKLQGENLHDMQDPAERDRQIFYYFMKRVTDRYDFLKIFFVTRAGVTGDCGVVQSDQGFFVLPLFRYICCSCSELVVCTSPAIACGLHAV